MPSTPDTDVPYTKVCTRCGQRKFVPEFYLNRQTGYRPPHCKVCHRAHMRRYYAENGPACRERMRRYRAANKARIGENTRQWKRRHPERVREYSRRYRRRNPQHEACRRASHALRELGLLEVADTCEDCGAPADVMHHPDYSDPWRVVPLCHRCHAARHHAVWRRTGGGPVKYPEEYDEE